MRRVTRGQIIILTYDPLFRGFWLTDYIPELIDLDEAQMPRLTDFEAWLGPIKVNPVPVPHDCSDGILCAYWRRPAAYLNPQVRSAISCFRALRDTSSSLEKLADDLQSGEWHRRFSGLLELEECDLGYRLVVTP